MNVSPSLKRAIITNDDGIDAPGLCVLVDVAKEVFEEVWIVAPAQDQSGTSQCISLNAPVRYSQKGVRKWSVTGTPSDCAILAINHFMKNDPPSVLLSGINGGDNTGDCVNLSGTLGAAFTGLMLNVPSIAISMDRKSRDCEKWETARSVLPNALRQIISAGWKKDCCLSINLPDADAEQIKGMVRVPPRKKTIRSYIVEERLDLREKPYIQIVPRYENGIEQQNDDVSALRNHMIAISEIALERKDYSE